MMTTEDKILLGQAINIVGENRSLQKLEVDSDNFEVEVKNLYSRLRRIKAEVQEELANE